MKINYRTAIKRSKISAPTQYLINNNLLVGKRLDYGCGHGFDAGVVGADKYDPHYFNAFPGYGYDTIYCNYVLNVIEDERLVLQALYAMQSLLSDKGTAYITVRRDLKPEQTGVTTKGFQALVELGLDTVVHRKNKFQIYKLTRAASLKNTTITM